MLAQYRDNLLLGKYAAFHRSDEESDQDPLVELAVLRYATTG